MPAVAVGSAVMCTCRTALSWAEVATRLAAARTTVAVHHDAFGAPHAAPVREAAAGQTLYL
jgi:hypothetical protein